MKVERMTVGELREELEQYPDDMKIVFELADDDITPDSVTSYFDDRIETVALDKELDMTFSCEVLGNLNIEFMVMRGEGV